MLSTTSSSSVRISNFLRIHHSFVHERSRQDGCSYRLTILTMTLSSTNELFSPGTKTNPFGLILTSCPSIVVPVVGVAVELMQHAAAIVLFLVAE